MNPFGLILILLGIIIFVIGFKGTQSSILSLLKGSKNVTSAGEGTASSATAGEGTIGAA